MGLDQDYSDGLCESRRFSDVKLFHATLNPFGLC